MGLSDCGFPLAFLDKRMRRLFDFLDTRGDGALSRDDWLCWELSMGLQSVL